MFRAEEILNNSKKEMKNHLNCQTRINIKVSIVCHVYKLGSFFENLLPEFSILV